VLTLLLSSSVKLESWIQLLKTFSTIQLLNSWIIETSSQLWHVWPLVTKNWIATYFKCSQYSINSKKSNNSLQTWFCFLIVVDWQIYFSAERMKEKRVAQPPSPSEFWLKSTHVEKIVVILGKIGVKSWLIIFRNKIDDWIRFYCNYATTNEFVQIADNKSEP